MLRLEHKDIPTWPLLAGEKDIFSREGLCHLQPLFQPCWLADPGIQTHALSPVLLLHMLCSNLKTPPTLVSFAPNFQILALPITGCLRLGKLPKPSVSHHTLIFKVRIMIVFLPHEVVMVKLINVVYIKLF